jgi:hypothetical protein
MPGPNVYAPIPDFDQETQMVIQLAPVDEGDYIYYGVEVVDLPPQNDPPDTP